MPLRIVVLSDTHGLHRQVAIPDGDVLVHCGDLTRHGTPAEVREFNDWAGSLPHRWKVVCAGNHDECFQYEPERARALLTNAVYLEDGETTAAGLRIWGSPWTPDFNNWHFNLPRGETLKAKWDMIPDGIDMLVTHGPPYGVLDEVSSGEHVGCVDLMAAVKRLHPKYHLFGHVHESPGLQKEDGITFVNAVVCDRAYAPKRRPWVVKIL